MEGLRRIGATRKAFGPQVMADEQAQQAQQALPLTECLAPTGTRQPRYHAPAGGPSWALTGPPSGPPHRALARLLLGWRHACLASLGLAGASLVCW